MSFLKMTFKPGINRDQTNYSGEGGWYACDRTRFRLGFPRSIGGWLKRTPTPFHGVSRQFHNWITTFHDNLLAIGTSNKLYIEVGGNFNDITPLREVQPVEGPGNTQDSLTTLIGDKLIYVVLAFPHNAITDSFVTVAGATAIGGIPASEVNGNHEITFVNPNTFTYKTTTKATATVNGGGGNNITFSFEIPPGTASSVSGYGWGVGPWGRNAWGLGSNTPVTLQQRDWWLDNFDNDLVANIRDGSIYYWARGPSIDPVPSLSTRAILLSDVAAADGFNPDYVPLKVMQILVSQQDKHLIAFGAVPWGSTQAADFDPLLIRWSDQDSPSDWDESNVAHSAGSLRVSRGSKIVRALPTRQEILVWTDAKLYALQFLGTTDVYGIQEYADNVSIIGPRACISASNVTYWMGDDKFYAYTGRVDTLPCTLIDHVFGDIDKNQTDHIVCGTNEQWNEVWWFYPSANAIFNDRYVVYNYYEQAWYYGSIKRTAWLDYPLRQQPLAAQIAEDIVSQTPMSYLMVHEVGTDDDQLPLNSFILSNDFDLGDGEQFMLTRRIIPDVDFEGSTVQDPSVKMQILPRNFPGSDPFPDIEDTQVIASGNITNYTQQVFVRARARQMAFKIMSEQLGVSWHLGACRVDGREDGKR